MAWGLVAHLSVCVAGTFSSAQQDIASLTPSEILNPKPSSRQLQHGNPAIQALNSKPEALNLWALNPWALIYLPYTLQNPTSRSELRIWGSGLTV